MPAERYLGNSLSEDALVSYGSMEGWSEPAVQARGAPKEKKGPPAWLGYAAAGAVAAVAYGLYSLPVQALKGPGPAILAILVGVAARNLISLPGALLEASKGVVRKLVPVNIVLTGAGLNLVHLGSVGTTALTVTVVCMILALASACYLGRAFGLWRRTSLLIGAGTAVCGNSAILAVAPLINAEDDDVVLAVGTTSLLGLLLMLAMPLAGLLLGMDAAAYGVWAGSSIHAVPQAVAAGFAFSKEAGTLATLVKLVRVAMLAPLVFALATLYARRRVGPVTVHYTRLVPMFLWGFLALALLNTLNLLPEMTFRPAEMLGLGEVQVSLSRTLAAAGQVALTLAMAAMGLEINVRLLAKVGGRALLTGAASCLILCAASFGLIGLFL